MHHRKKPFSAKQKKLQLQEKRQRHQQSTSSSTSTSTSSFASTSSVNVQHASKNTHSKTTGGGVYKKMQQNVGVTTAQHNRPSGAKAKKENRLSTVFEKEPQEEIEKRKLEAQLPLKRITISNFPSDTYYGELIDIPLRPPWDYDTSKEELEKNEARMFKQYLDNIYDKYPRDRLNYFEHNLEVWRQLWRVCEMSDILFVLADCRHPLFHFPPSLYRYVVKSMCKPLVLVLTKTDLVPENNVQLWLNYFKKNFPGLLVTAARSFERDATNLAMGKKRRRPIKKKKQLPQGVRQLIEFINSLIIERGCQPLELSEEVGDDEETDRKEDERRKGDEEEMEETEGKEEMEEEDTDDEQPDDLKEEELKRIEEAKQENHYEVQKDSDVVVLGFIGHPNVGKSTLINTLKGKKVCSTSRTPGHTKYKQTVFLNKSVMLCDCPGLVFPACDVPKVLQVVCGIYPIAQVREPYTAIKYIAERVPLEEVYKLDKLNPDEPWTAWSICEAYAEKRGYHTKKGRPDTHRAGLEILRDHLDGRVVLYFSPYSTKIDVRIYEEGPPPSRPKEGEEIQEEEEEEEEEAEAEEEEEEEEKEKDAKRKYKQSKSKKRTLSTSSEEEEEEDDKVSHENRFSLLEDE